MTDAKKLATAIVMALVSVMIGYLLLNSLFTPTNTSATNVCTTYTSAGYTTEATLITQSWSFYLLAFPLLMLGGAVKLVIDAFK